VSVASLPRSKSIAIENPTASEKWMLFFSESAITVAKIESILQGSATPSVTFSIRYGTDMSGSGNGSRDVRNHRHERTTTGSATTSFNSASVPANNFVWITTSAQSGTVTALQVSVIY
jgi:hypothetical protein